MFGSAKSERPTLTNCEIIFEEFDVITIHQRHRQTDRQTDGRTDDMRSQDSALHCSALRGKKRLAGD